MGDFKLKKHKVQETRFCENIEIEKNNDIEVGVQGSILIPKNFELNKNIIVQLKFRFGKEEERLFLYLETISVFEPVDTVTEVDKGVVEKQCIPVALGELRKTVKMVTESFGMPPLDLPPFDGENL